MTLDLDDDVTSGPWAGLHRCGWSIGDNWWQWAVGNDAYCCRLSGGWLALSTPYSPALLRAIKHIPGRFRRYDPAGRVWLIQPHPSQLRYITVEVLKAFCFIIHSDVVRGVVRRGDQ